MVDVVPNILHFTAGKISSFSRYTPMSDAMLAKAVDAAPGGVEGKTLFPGDVTPGFSTPAGDIDMKKIGQV